MYLSQSRVFRPSDSINGSRALRRCGLYFPCTLLSSFVLLYNDISVGGCPVWASEVGEINCMRFQLFISSHHAGPAAELYIWIMGAKVWCLRRGFHSKGIRYISLYLETQNSSPFQHTPPTIATISVFLNRHRHTARHKLR